MTYQDAHLTPLGKALKDAIPKGIWWEMEQDECGRCVLTTDHLLTPEERSVIYQAFDQHRPLGITLHFYVKGSDFITLSTGKQLRAGDVFVTFFGAYDVVSVADGRLRMKPRPWWKRLIDRIAPRC